MTDEPDETPEDSATLDQCGFVPEDYDEYRRQWCLVMACFYFAGSGFEKTTDAAAKFEEFLKKGKTAIRSVK